jgi:F5/8 type C domain
MTPPEAPGRQQARSSVRELWDAAAQLHSAAVGPLSFAAATLHREAILIAFRALCGLERSVPTEEVVRVGAQLLEGRVGPQTSVSQVCALVAEGFDALDERGADQLRSVHHLLVTELERELAAAQARRQWWIFRSAVLAVGSVLAGFALSQAIAWFSGPVDLAKGKAWTTSSTWAVCHPDKQECGGQKTRILFSTREELGPWFTVDLGAPQAVSRVEVTNRSDLALDYAVPLVVELSDDGVHFKEVSRRLEPFAVWDARFPAQRAQAVRLRVDRFSALQLEAVRVFR